MVLKSTPLLVLVPNIEKNYFKCYCNMNTTTLRIPPYSIIWYLLYYKVILYRYKSGLGLKTVDYYDINWHGMVVYNFHIRFVSKLSVINSCKLG